MHPICSIFTGLQTCSLPICPALRPAASVQERPRRGRSPSFVPILGEFGTCDRARVDFIRSVGEPPPPHMSPIGSELKIAGTAAAAMRLNRTVDDADRYARCLHLAHGNLVPRYLVTGAVPQSGRPETHSPHPYSL